MSTENQYLTFRVGKENFGLEVGTVREIVSYEEITHIPMMPLHIPGVINLRGAAVPVIDLNMRFNDVKTELTKRTAIIIVNIHIRERHVQLGLIVDTVSEVVNIKSDQVEPRPEFSNSINTDFINGITKINDRFVIILNMAEVLNFEDIEYLNRAQKTGGSLISGQEH